MIPFGQVQPMVGSSCGVSHVAKVKAGRDYHVVILQREALLIALHFHNGKSVLCLGGEEDCPVCFSEGTEARWFAFWAAQELIDQSRGCSYSGRRAVIQVPYMTFVRLMRQVADLGDSSDQLGLECVFRRSSGLRSPVLVNLIKRLDVSEFSIVDERLTFDLVVKWLGLPACNCDLDAFKARVKKLVASPDFYSTWDYK